MKKEEWMFLDINENPNKMICKRCGAKATSPTPCRLEDAEQIMKTFLNIHRKCRKSKQEKS